VRIVISKFGEVDVREVRRMVEVIEECYRRLEPHEVDLVDLNVFERSSSVEGFLTKECREVGVVSAPFDELFFAMHDAWRGTSRVILCLERMRLLPQLVQLGGIRHEVGHSVLHGSLRYYLLPFPPDLLDFVNRFGFSREYAANVLYLASIAVKDYEVTRLLYKRGYVKDQVAYARHLLTVSEDDKLSWETSRGKPLAEALCLISCLKSIGCAVPLLPDQTFGQEIKREMVKSLSYLPADYSDALLKIVLNGFPTLGTDTLDNINCIVDKCKIIFEMAFNSLTRQEV